MCSVVTKNFLIELIADDSNYNEIYAITDMNILPIAMETSSLFQNALVPAENDSLRFDIGSIANTPRKIT
ncbi:Cytolytic delta-endotoxin (Insecticidal protein) (fragment) [Xenorhabdus nematophila str. Anatoliense]